MVKFSILARTKKIVVTREFRHWVERIFFTSFHPGVKLYFQRFSAYFTKPFYRKSIFRLQLQDYKKAMMLNFTKKRSEVFMILIGSK